MPTRSTAAAPSPRLRSAAVALLIAAIAAGYAVSARRLPVGILNDDAANVLLALSLGRGHYAFPGGFGAPEQFLPAFPALLAIPALLVAPDWGLLRAVPLAFAALTMLLAWRLARRFLSPAAAGAAVLLTALNPVLFGLGGLLLPYMPYLALTLALIDGVGARPTRRSLLLLTAGAALAPLLRPHGALLVALLAAALWRRDGPRRAGIFFFAALLPAALWTAARRLGGAPVHDYASVWRENLPAAGELAERGSRILLKMFGEGFIVAPDLPRLGQYALALATLGLALAGALRILKKRKDLRAFVLAAYAAGVILLHLTWRWVGNRYIIPIVPMLWILIVAAAEPLLSRHRVLAGSLLAVLVLLPLHVEWIAVLNGSDGDAQFQPRTMAWIRDHVPAEARLQSVKDYSVALLTGHPCSAQPVVKRAGDWLLLAQSEKIDYAHLQLRRPNDEFGVGDLPDAYEPFLADWLAGRKESQRVFDAPDEGGMIFRVAHP